VPDTALGTTPLRNVNRFKLLQRARMQSSHPIIAPAAVLDIEVFARNWQSAISVDGGAVEVGRWRERTLVAP